MTNKDWIEHRKKEWKNIVKMIKINQLPIKIKELKMKFVLSSFLAAVIITLTGCAISPVAEQLNEDKLLLVQCREVIDGSKKLDELNQRAMINEINTNIMAIQKALQGEKVTEKSLPTVDYIVYLIAQYEQQKRTADDNYLRLQQAVQASTIIKK